MVVAGRFPFLVLAQSPNYALSAHGELPIHRGVLSAYVTVPGNFLIPLCYHLPVEELAVYFLLILFIEK